MNNSVQRPGVFAWLRRAVSFSALFGSWVLVMTGLPVWLLICLILDAMARDSRLAKFRCALFFALYLTCEVVGLLACLAVWLRTGVGRWSSARTLEANRKLQVHWTRALLYGAMAIFSMKMVVEGLDHVQPGPVIVFIRHASTADTVLPTVLVTGQLGLPLRFVLKKELLWDPCLDVVGRRLPNVFIDRSGRQTRTELAAIDRMVRDTPEKEGVLIYPEGTRFDEAKRRRILKKMEATAPADRYQRAVRFRHVLPPRPGGALAAMAAAPRAAIVFCMHTGLEGASNFYQFWHGGLIGQTIRVAFKRGAAPEEIPEAPEDRLAWLYERWQEVDDWIHHHRSEAVHP